MRYLAWTLVLYSLMGTPADAHNQCDKAACAEVKEKIRTIESRKRSGYSRAQGERYRARLRELRAKRYKICR